jgi:hypothetical protein
MIPDAGQIEEKKHRMKLKHKFGCWTTSKETSEWFWGLAIATIDLAFTQLPTRGRRTQIMAHQ